MRQPLHPNPRTGESYLSLICSHSALHDFVARISVDLYGGGTIIAILRCYAEKKDGYWIATCPQFTLAAQGDTFEEAKEKLERQIKPYVVEALTVDKEHAADLLGRRAPLSMRLGYEVKAFFWSLAQRRSAKKKIRFFNEPTLQYVC
ncbi:type II toxin-antitoxin system HicB family antitoxin [Pseudomonas alkylphenolica]|uniref:type II toxin-antitoxin system HicB family antitoxin n=1 Tax=Pseudomonas alkylphenolica TaxID=237609 RepID=UPI0012FD196F|nr:hypothetical protein [Pseudomonas alkylphenolica]